MSFERDVNAVSQPPSASKVDDNEEMKDAMTGEKSDTYIESGTEEKVDEITVENKNYEDELVEIKNPLKFTMLQESDVKVNDTDSSKANLMLKDRMVYDDDHTQNDQIISPSDGIQVQNGKFYQYNQMNKEIKSSQVQKKNENPIHVADNFDHEVESQKVDSSQPLDQMDINDDHDSVKELKL